MSNEINKVIENWKFTNFLGHNGVDDYIVKPNILDELISDIRSTNPNEVERLKNIINSAMSELDEL